MIGYMYTKWEHTALELPMHKAEVLRSTPQAQLFAEASSPLSERKEVATYAPARESVWIPLLLAAANGAIKCCSAAHKACREGGVQQAAPSKSTSAPAHCSSRHTVAHHYRGARNGRLGQILPPPQSSTSGQKGYKAGEQSPVMVQPEGRTERHRPYKRTQTLPTPFAITHVDRSEEPASINNLTVISGPWSC